MKVKNILKYQPSKFGEHMIDSVLHNSFIRLEDFHEVFCNPPGGTWTDFNIHHLNNKKIYRWDHIPRNPPSYVKLPDQIVQYLNSDNLELLFIESKKTLSELDPKIGTKMIDYFEGKKNFDGIEGRPAWHKLEDENWEVISEESSKSERYWLNSLEETTFWKGFAFSDHKSNEFFRIEKMLKSALDESDIHIAIYIEWEGEYKIPSVYLKGSSKIKKNPIWADLSELKEIRNSNIKIL